MGRRATGKSNIVVGNIDTGIDYMHLDLYLNVWLNQGEVPPDMVLDDTNGDGLITFRDLNDAANQSFVTDLNGNDRIDAGDLLKDARWADGVDGDGNGYVDDLIGWDFVNNDNNPFDDNNHGTHTSGTIGAIGGNATGVAGMAWNVQIAAMKFLSATGSGFIANAVLAEDYFTKAAAQSQAALSTSEFIATNNSWGGGGQWRLRRPRGQQRLCRRLPFQLQHAFQRRLRIRGGCRRTGVLFQFRCENG